MDGNYKAYDWERSADRIANILDLPSGQFEEVDNLPSRDKLTFTNGFYRYCSALFVDIRDSSSLPGKHKRPALAKLYRAFISEMVAVLNSEDGVREVNIVGDCVWAVYNTPLKSDIDDVFTVAFTANTLIKLLNRHYSKRGLTELSIGIGVDYGRVLMIKAGHSGSTINDVVYMGDVVNRAAHLAHKAGRGYLSSPIWAGDVFYSNLNEHNQGLMSQIYDADLGYVYKGNVVRTAMNDWLDAN